MEFPWFCEGVHFFMDIFGILGPVVLGNFCERLITGLLNEVKSDLENFVHERCSNNFLRINSYSIFRLTMQWSGRELAHLQEYDQSQNHVMPLRSIPFAQERPYQLGHL